MVQMTSYEAALFVSYSNDVESANTKLEISVKLL